MSVQEKLTDEECYLWCMLSDPAGIDAAELLLTDEENFEVDEEHGKDGTYCFRAWDFQISWWRDESNRRIDLGSRSCGKSLSIKLEALVFPVQYPGGEMVLTAPEGNHLDLLTDAIENMFLQTRFCQELLVNGRTGIKHRPFKATFQNGAHIIGRIPGIKGVALKGLHCNVLHIDEAQDFEDEAWVEVTNTLRRGSNTRWFAHGVTRGVRGKFYDYTTDPNLGWSIHWLPAMYRPNWSEQERKDNLDLYGSDRDPNYLRNVMGLHGDAMSPILDQHRLMRTVDMNDIKSENPSDYNTRDYYNLRIDPGKIEHVKNDITMLIHPPESQLEKWSSFWVGADIGLVRDPTVVVVFGEEFPKDGESKLRLLTKITCNRVPTPYQAKLFLRLFEIYDPHVIAIDRTGNGRGVYETTQYWARDVDDDPSNGSARAVLERFKGYNFDEKILWDYDDKAQIDPRGRGKAGAEEAEVWRIVKEAATDVIREMVDAERLILPYDRDVIGELQGQSWTYEKGTLDAYGKRRSFSKGYFHTLDAFRMALLGWKQQPMDAFVKAQESVVPASMPIFITESPYGNY